MKTLSIRIAVALSILLTNLSLCSAEEAPAKQVLTSFVSCQVSNTALDKAGISDNMLHDANSCEMVAAKVLSLLHDPNTAKLLANPKILTLDGEAARMEIANIKIDLTASIQENALISAMIGWKKTDSNVPGIGFVTTKTRLHAGQPAVLSWYTVRDQTFFLIATSEILDPNKAKANSVSAEQNIALQSAKRLNSLAKYLMVYANDHNERFPDNFEQLINVDVNDTDIQWLQENVEYPGAGKPVTSPADEVIAYDKTLLEKFEKTNVLYCDTSVESVTAERLKHDLGRPTK